MTEEMLIWKKIEILADAIIEADKYGQLCPQTIKLLEEIKGDEK